MELSDFFRENPRAALAFSGGTDSAYLLYEALQCGAEVRPYYVKTPFQPRFELDDALRLTKELGTELTVIEYDILNDGLVAANPADRCYHCKRAGFTAIVNHAKSLGFPTVIDGSNASDRGDYRPGMRAAQELGVRSPLMEVGFTKDEERELLRAWGYPVWNLPAGACLATRVPTGEELTREKVDVIRACEDYLHDLDLAQVRARLIGGCMHIEAAPADVAKIAALGRTAVNDEGKAPLPAAIESALRNLGCGHISPEVTPYIHGNMNQ